MLNIGIIGYGYWGPNLLRNFSSIGESCKVKTVSDMREERLALARRAYGHVQTVKSADDIINDPGIDAVAIATPVFTHFELAKRAMLAGKHVLVEKPMTMSLREADELVELSEKHNKVLMVDHTFLYTDAVRKMKHLINSGDIGEVNYYDSTRINLGLFQTDVNVLWDLAPHDISILMYLIDKKPTAVQATGIAHHNNGLENIAYMTVYFDSELIAHFNCSWVSPVKVRMTLIGGDKKMLMFNDMEPTEKLKVYDSGVNVKTSEDKYRLSYEYRAGDIYIPKIESTEALAFMARDFISAIEKGTVPESNKHLGREVVRILEASQHSIKNKGMEVAI